MTGEAGAWHLVAGDWQVLPPDDERARGLWAAIGESVRAYVALDRDDRVTTSVLALPFYRSTTSPDARLALYELAIPPDVDDLGLERWCYLLWDGADFLQSMTWLNESLYLGEQGWETSLLDEHGEFAPALADLYARYFCSFLAGDNADIESPTPFMLVDSPVRRGPDRRVLARAAPVVAVPGSEYWHRVAAEALQKGVEAAAPWLRKHSSTLASDPEFGHYAEQLSLAADSFLANDADAELRKRADEFMRGLLTRIAVGESRPAPTGPAYYTMPLPSTRDVVRCTYGYRSFDVQMKLVRHERDVMISFVDDVGTDDGSVEQALWVRRWRDLAFLCREVP